MFHRFFTLITLLTVTTLAIPYSLLANPLPTNLANSLPNFGQGYRGPLYRTQITLHQPTDLPRAKNLVTRVLQVNEDTALILANSNQLTDLARLGFRPRHSDRLDRLGFTLFTLNHTPTLNALINAPLVDSDNDGLTDDEEGWWCTDPANPNSDADANGYTDGQEVTALLDFTLPRSVRWGYGAPFGPPNAWPDWNGQDGNPNTPACNDGDYDTIPDFAEIYMVGSQVPEESTDRDKFDDGQELFGVTYCPGAPTSCGYGNYPRQEYWNYIKATMPSWVLPPGDNIFVAAFPEPEVSVVPGSWAVNRVTTITTSEGQMTETTNSYATSVTEGQSTSRAETIAWNQWEEVSKAREAPEEQTGAELEANRRTILAIPAVLAAAAGIVVGTATIISAVADVKQAFFTPDHGPDIIQNLENIGKYTSDLSNGISTSNERLQTINSTLDSGFQGVQGSLDGVQRAINNQGQLISWGLHDISYQLSRPRVTETKTSGTSWGGAQTTTHEEYEEHTITEGQAFTSGQNWSTAWAVDSSHAADLTFTYIVENSGTEYARELTGLVFNIYLGDDTEPIISYPAWEQFPDGKIENIFPGNFLQFTSNPVPLTLDQMMRIDLGELLTIVLADYSYGADELFYQDAANGGLTVFVEDGVEDGNELVDSYLIPTWGVETVQDVLTRYFPSDVDNEGNLNTLWTPEFNGINPPTWNEHFLSDIAWWNIYQTCPPEACADIGATPLHLQDAQAGGAILFRFNRDSDRDGYQDRVEMMYGTDKDDPADHPQPELLAGYVATRNGNEVTVLLKLANSGTFDAYGIDAVMYAPDSTTTIGNNTVGGNGVVAAGQDIAVGSLVMSPDLTNWGSSTAQPYSTGNYIGSSDNTYTFTVGIPGVVGQANATLNWTNSSGGSGTLNLGSNYHAPLPIVVADGLELGFDTGTLLSGTEFTAQALTPRDTFTYTIESEPYTPPVIVVSYSDPQGSHRFVTPIALDSLSDDLSTYSGQMLPDARLDIIATDVFTPTGPNTTQFVVNSPDPTPIEAGHLYLNFVMSGTLVAELPYTMTIQPGPTVYSMTWSTDVFTQTFDPAAETILIAFWTDAQGNIIDSTARPFDTFQADPRPAAAISTTSWDFGTVPQGTFLQQPLVLANTGYGSLISRMGNTENVSLSVTGIQKIATADTQSYEMRLDTTLLPVGPFSETISIFTSDVANPTLDVVITGNVISSTLETPAAPTERPLDWSAYIAGAHDQGEWVEFSHTLGPEALSLHPVKVYSQDYVTFWGVGKYALPFAQGTTSFDLFGSGSDGNKTVVSGETSYTDDTRSALSATAAAGQNLVNLATTSGFIIGQEILLVQMQGTNVGRYEFQRISGINGNTLTLEKNLVNTYTVGGTSRSQAIRVMNYANLTVQSGGVLTAHSWDGNTGGILAVKVSGTAQINGQVRTNGIGYRGGDRGEYSDPIKSQGWQGESYNQGAIQSRNPNNGAGGGGEGDDNTGCPGGGKCGGAGGGGGSYGSAGNNGFPGGDKPSQPGIAGATYGNQELSSIVYLGSGGGGGGSDDNNAYPGGYGGSGGGIVFISARTLNVTSSIAVNGAGGTEGNTGGRTGGGGGGSGGSILLRGADVSIGTNLVVASGGSAGAGHNTGGWGGVGGVGRVHVQYCNTMSGSTNPAAFLQELDCYIVEQIESSPYDHARLNLPESFSDGRYYTIQYGRKLNYGSAGDQSTALRTSASMKTSAFLDVLLSGVSVGDLTLRLDIGNDNSWDWEWTGNVNDSATLNSLDLAASMNRYWIAQGSPMTGTFDIPVRVYLSKAGQVILTNLQVTPVGNQVRYINLSSEPYSDVALSVEVDQDWLFVDDFSEDVPGIWEETHGTWEVINGVYDGIGAGGGIDAWTYAGEETWTDYSLSTRINMAPAGNQTTGQACLLLRSTGLWSNEYRIEIWADSSPSYLNRVAVIRYKDGIVTYLFDQILPIAIPDVIDARVDMGGDHLQLYIDGVKWVDLHDPDGLTEGRVGLGVVWDWHAQFDNVQVLSLEHGQPGDSTSVAVAMDVGDDGGIDWAAESQANYPALFNTGNLADTFNDFLAGQTGNIDVPLRFFLAPYLRLNLLDYVAVPSSQPDVAIATEDIALENSLPTEGEMVTATVTLHNLGDLSAAPHTLAYYISLSDGSDIYVGSRLVTGVDVGGSAEVPFIWDSIGYTGPITLTAVIDPYDRLPEVNEDNNQASVGLTVLTRPDLTVSAIAPVSSPRLTLPTNIAVTTLNQGETDAAVHTLNLYAGDPEAGGVLIGSQAISITAGLSVTAVFSWTPVAPGPVDLVAIADSAHAVNEYNEANNTQTEAAYVGWGDPLYVDAGGATDGAYSTATGYGYLTAGTVNSSCGSQPYQTYRQMNSGEQLQYRFDHLLPERFYHLDLTFFLCTGSRTLRVLIDGVEVANNVVANSQGNALSLLLDSSFLTDKSIIVTVEKTGGGLGGAVVSELKLSDIRYCYRDSGLSTEVGYSGAVDGCGWLDGIPDNSWGNLPHQTVRYDEDGGLQYRFDQLDPVKAYQILLTFYEGDGAGRIQTVTVDGVTVLSNVVLGSTVQYLVVDVPLSSYVDGSILVQVGGTSQPVISEIAISEKTILSIPVPTPTPTATPNPTSTPTPTLTPTATPTPANTGFRSPTTQIAGVAGDGNGYESNPNNAFIADNVFAVDTDSGTSTTWSCTNISSKDNHRFYGYTFPTMPANALIQGVTVRLDGKADSSVGSPRFCVQLSWDGGATWSSPKVINANLTTARTNYYLGSAADLWGHAWLRSEFATTAFRLRVVNVSSDPTRDFYLDWVSVRVHYTTP